MVEIEGLELEIKEFFESYISNDILITMDVDDLKEVYLKYIHLIMLNHNNITENQWKSVEQKIRGDWDG